LGIGPYCSFHSFAETKLSDDVLALLALVEHVANRDDFQMTVEIKGHVKLSNSVGFSAELCINV